MKYRLKKTAGRYDHDAPGDFAPMDRVSSPQDREELDRFHTNLDSKVDTQAMLQKLFGYAQTSREKERAKARKLFRQGEVATSNAPGLQPNVLETPPLEQEAGLAHAVKTASVEKMAGMARVRRIGFSAVRKKAFETGTAGVGLDNAAEVAGMKLERRMARYPGGEGGYFKAHGFKEPKGKATKETATALVNQFRPTRAAQVSKTASIAPRVDAWFEKNAHLLLTEAQRRYPELLKAAAIPSPTLKRGKSTPMVQSSLAGGSA